MQDDVDDGDESDGGSPAHADQDAVNMTEGRGTHVRCVCNPLQKMYFFGDDLWMKWLTDGDENPCWLNCKWVILVMCECLASLCGLPSPKSNFHTRSQPKRSSPSLVLGFGAKRHVSKVVKIQKDFGSTNLGSVETIGIPYSKFFLNPFKFPRFLGSKFSDEAKLRTPSTWGVLVGGSEPSLSDGIWQWPLCLGRVWACRALRRWDHTGVMWDGQCF